MINLELKQKFVEKSNGLYILNKYNEIVPTNNVYLSNEDIDYLINELTNRDKISYRRLIDKLTELKTNNKNVISFTTNGQLGYPISVYTWSTRQQDFEYNMKLDNLMNTFKHYYKESNKFNFCYYQKSNSNFELQLIDILTKYSYNVTTYEEYYYICIDYKHIYQTLDEVTQLLLDNPMAPNYIQVIRSNLFKLANKLNNFDEYITRELNFFDYEQNKNK